MLELSRLKVGEFNAVLKTFDLKNTLSELTQSFSQEAKIKGVGV